MASKRALSTLQRPLRATIIPSRSLQQFPRTAPFCSCLSKPQTNSYAHMPRLRQPKRHFTTTLSSRKQDDPSVASQSQSQSQPQTQPPSKLYTFPEIQDLSTSPTPHRILIDVREPAELHSTGRIPHAQNLPISTAADGFFLPADEFEDRFGFPRPGKEDEVIFYCKAGVRSRAAAALARQAGFGGEIAEFPGSWIEWMEKGGEVERGMK